MALRTIIKLRPGRIIFTVILVIILKTVESAREVHYLNTDGVITSKNYPNTYPDDFNSVYKIEVSPESKIKLIFDDFEMERHSECNYDSIIVYDGPDEGYPVLGKFCGTKRPPIITTRSNKMLILFKTDGSNTLKGFKATVKTELNINAIVPRATEGKLIQGLLNKIRQKTFSINKWGKEITRSAVALFLHKPQTFSVANYIGEEIAYELSLQLMSKLVMKKKIATNDLALFINAMTVSCIDPKKFFGLNLVDELHKRIENSNNTNPFFIMTVCKAGKVLEAEYINKLQQLGESPLLPYWTGTQAMTVMALKCISQQSNVNLNTILAKMLAELKSKQQVNGTVEDLKTTALVVQALMATESYRTDFNFTMAIKSIFNDLKIADLNAENVYYILPILKLKTILDINSNHCANFIPTEIEELKTLTHENTDERIHVQISVIIGDDMDFTRTWSVKVPSNFSLYQVMENISSSDPDYKVRYTTIDGKPYISALSRYEYNIQDGFFWFIYKKPISSTNDWIPLKDSPVDIHVNETDELILWYNSGSPPFFLYARTDTTDADTTINTTDAKNITDTTDADIIM